MTTKYGLRSKAMCLAGSESSLQAQGVQTQWCSGGWWADSQVLPQPAPHDTVSMGP